MQALGHFHSHCPSVSVQTDFETMNLKDTLRFTFSGYSIWLDPEQYDSDLDNAVLHSSKALGSFPIPAPHVTALYGITDLTEVEMMTRFRTLFLNQVRNWPPLQQKGFISGTEFDGVNGGTMDMSWMEVSYETSAEHEALLNLLREWFSNSGDFLAVPPWAPHASLAYTNPESPISTELLLDVIQRYPTLKQNRRITGVSLWKTHGTIDQWKCLDSIQFKALDNEQ